MPVISIFTLCDFLLATKGALRIEGKKWISLSSEPNLTEQFHQKLGEYNLEEPKAEKCDTNCKFHPLIHFTYYNEVEVGGRELYQSISLGLFLLYLNI